jgi:hypothetical protein
MSSAERWAYGLSFAGHGIAFVVFFIGFLVFRDRDKTRTKSSQKEVAGLSTIHNLFLSALYGYFLFVKPGRWERTGDSVKIQWERWFVYTLMAPLQAVSIASFNGATTRNTWFMMLSFFLMGLFLLFGDITSYAGPFMFLILAVASWAMSIVQVVASKRRDADRRYWLAWIWAVIAPVLHAAGYLFGSAATGEISFDFEVWIFSLGDILLWIVFDAVASFAFGTRVFSDKSKANDHEDEEGGEEDDGDVLPEDSPATSRPDDSVTIDVPTPQTMPVPPQNRMATEADVFHRKHAVTNVKDRMKR